MKEKLERLKNIMGELIIESGQTLKEVQEKTTNREKDECLADYKRLCVAYGKIKEIFDRETRKKGGEKKE